MSHEIPINVPHLTKADTDEMDRLLRLVFKEDDGAANKWLHGRSGVFLCTPLDLIKRDELGVVRVISYLKDAAP